MLEAGLAGAFLVGLLGGGHCAGMCAGIVGALSGRGLVYLALGREGAALAAFDAALAIYPNLQGRDTHIKQLREKVRGQRI